MPPTTGATTGPRGSAETGRVRHYPDPALGLSDHPIRDAVGEFPTRVEFAATMEAAGVVRASRVPVRVVPYDVAAGPAA